jgi:multidrug efflux pump
MMTTMAAMLGALPLALGSRDGRRARRPVGVTCVGVFIGTQPTELYTTPVVYLYLERFRLFLRRPRTVAAPERSAEAHG